MGFIDVTVSIQGLQAVQEMLDSIGIDLTEALAPANEELRQEVVWEISNRYPNGMAMYWQVTADSVPGALLSITAQTTDRLVLWYEFGTREHVIEPKNPDGVLHFIGTHEFAGEDIYAMHVDHPGESAHDISSGLAAFMAAEAASRWEEAILALIDSFSA